MAASRARRAPAASKGTLMAARDRFSLRNLYLYLVCLITLIIVIFSAVSLVRGAVELAYPDPNYYGYEAVPDRDGELTEEEIARREQAAADSQRRNALLGIVYSGTLLLIAGPLYVYHWRRIQEERPPEVPAAPGAGPLT
jgi:hypothetical protein